MKGVLAILLNVLYGVTPSDTAFCAHNHGIAMYKQETIFQGGKQEIRVLIPDTYTPLKTYKVLYVLPVGAGTGKTILNRFKEWNIHNEHDLIITEMTFEKTPWYGDHATDTLIRQETYIKEFVVPFIEKRYPTEAGKAGRLLLGFSKSGWGAFSLILRNPDFFGYAAAWDTPWMMDSFHFKTDEVFGTQERMNEYRPDLLVSARKAPFLNENRLVLAGESLWGMNLPPTSGRSHTKEFHLLLVQLGIQHSYLPQLNYKHTWLKEWVDPVVRAMMELSAPEGVETEEDSRRECRVER